MYVENKTVKRIGTLSENLYLRYFDAEIYANDSEEEKERKMNRVILLRTNFAVCGFMIAILTIVIGTFVDDMEAEV